jgi:sugar lactone lactonase YvrE
MKNKTTIFILCFFVISNLLNAQNKDLISVKIPGLTPEGITVNPTNGKFIISSAGNGNLVEVDMDGNTAIFADAPELISTLGTHVDPTNQYLVTAICDIGVSQRSKKEKFGQVASIAYINLKTKAVYKVIDLSSLIPNVRHFANDLTWDDKGNLYVTDSYAGAIYKVDKDYKASVFVSDTIFKLKNQYSFGLNGMVFDKKEQVLLVSKLDEGKLFKIPLKEPKRFDEIKLPTPTPADGILLQKDGALLLVSSVNTPYDNNSSGKIYKVTSSDNWKTANVKDVFDTGLPSATTITQKGNDLYTVHAYYFGKQPVAEFHIQKVVFKK